MVTGGVQPMGGRRGMLGDARGEGGTWRAQRSADTGTAPGGAPKPRGVPETRGGGKQSPEAQRHAEAAPGDPVPEDCRLKPRRG